MYTSLTFCTAFFFPFFLPVDDSVSETPLLLADLKRSMLSMEEAAPMPRCPLPPPPAPLSPMSVPLSESDLTSFPERSRSRLSVLEPLRKTPPRRPRPSTEESRDLSKVRVESYYCS